VQLGKNSFFILRLKFIFFNYFSLRLDERWGATPSAIDTCLRVAEYHDISVRFSSLKIIFSQLIV